MIHNFKASIQQLQIMHYALLGGVLFFAGVVYFLELPQKSGTSDRLYDIFCFMVPGLAAVSILMGRTLSKKIFASAAEKEDLGDKLAIFRSGMIIRWALVEGAALFAVVAFLLTNNLVMLLVALAAGGYLFTLRPTAESAASALGLSETEYRELV